VKGTDFKRLKERLIFIRDHLKGRQELASEKRAELIQALFSEGDLHRAQQIFSKSDQHKDAGQGSWLSPLADLFSLSKGRDEDSLQKEMKKLAKGVSDSDFLLDIKGITDEDLRTPVQEAEALAHTQLSSLIDRTVGKMTHAILWAQQDACKQSIRREVEANERTALGRTLVDFIRDINKCSMGRRNS